jgi:hypothetical protein
MLCVLYSSDIWDWQGMLETHEILVFLFIVYGTLKFGFFVCENV